ncbi:TIGR01906 family membrane protein [Clostridium intestinale]|uniref:TIGR01906 family membrane protein n=1 Tax=Clostridium intestinale TaxID=36845 RepID=A0A7D6ZKF1_9CLOT|nr:TIGR01906 family membrane protein [Clostridium intestinale]
MNKPKKKNHKLLQIMFSISLSLFIISSAVKLTLLFKPLYYFDIQYLNIVENTGYSKEDIIKNYNYVINYLLNPLSKEFKLPSISYSNYGQIHFNDVKKIFTSIDILLIVTGLFNILSFILNFKNKNINFLKQTYSILIFLPIILLSVFVVDFDSSFTTFHKIFFRNDYWQFDPKLDPIINILPQEFFLHSALLIVSLIFLSILILRIVYRKLKIKLEPQ